jgi:Protein of unknown function (DUF3631)
MAARKTEKLDPIVNKIRKFVSKFCLMTPEQMLVYVLWIMHTWQFSDQCWTPETTPYLYVNSSEKGSGKTIVGKDIVEVIARNPMGVNNVTEATLFHLCAMRSTIMVDEVDQIFAGAANRPLVSVLNAGYRLGGKVPRMVKGEVEMFPVHCPKSLIGIDNRMLAETTRDRCIPITLTKHSLEELEAAGVEKFYNYKVEREAEEISRELHAWALDHTLEIRDYDPEPIDSLTSGREWEISRPIVQIARAAGCEASAREALASIFEANRVEEVSLDDECLITIFELFGDTDTDRLRTNDILAALAEANDLMVGWNGKKLGNVLRPHGIKGGAIRFTEANTSKVDRGYMRSTFVKKWRAMGLDIPDNWTKNGGAA